MTRPTVLGVAGVTGTLGLLILLRYALEGDGPLGGAPLWMLVVGGAIGLAGYGLFMPRRASLTRFEPARLGAPGDVMVVLWGASLLSAGGGAIVSAWFVLQMSVFLGTAAYFLAAACLTGGAAAIWLLTRFRRHLLAWN